MADVVDIILRLRELRQFLSGTDQASAAILNVGKSSKRSGKQAEQGWKGIAKWAGGAAAIYGATRYIKGAVSATEDLAKSTIALQRQTNLDTKTASEWVGVLKERNISTRTFQVGLKTLSKQMETSRLGTQAQLVTNRKLRREYEAVAAAGGKKAPAALAKLAKQMDSTRAKGAKARGALAQLGVSMGAIRSGNTSAVINQIADGLSKIKNPAERSTLAQQLFGRSAIALLPVLLKGRKGIADLLAIQERYGNYLDGTGIKSTKQLIERQRELHAATEGVKIQLGTALLPVLLQVSMVLVKFARFMAPLTKNALLFKIALGALTVAFIAYKVAVIAATIATSGLTLASAIWIGVALLIAAAIVGLVVGFVYLYRHSERFRNAVDALWATVKHDWGLIVGALKFAYNWVKQNWPLLLGILGGPFTLAAVLIIKHIKQIKQFLADLVTYIKSIPSKIGGALGHLVPHVPGGGLFKSALHAIPHARGGTVTHGAPSLVGEMGPEILNLPLGSRITPLTGPAAAGAGALGADVIIPVYLDGREIARSVARVTADKLARR